MDLEMLIFRSRTFSLTRRHFDGAGYLEVDTPALSPALIPETSIEAFRADYLMPGSGGPERARPLYLVPSPEIYMKPLIASHGVSLYQLSKCYRNVESVGRIHSPEFTMLEYYTMNADAARSIDVTEGYLEFLGDRLFAKGSLPGHAADAPVWLNSPPLVITMDEAFARWAGFRLSSCPASSDLARHAKALEIGLSDDYSTWEWDDLYELILVHAVEPSLPKDRRVYITEYPARVPCLAREGSRMVEGREWAFKERWELYVNGVELANCYTEERDARAIEAFMESETLIKGKTARVRHAAVRDFGEISSRMPPCSGVAIGFDRLVMSLAGRSSIDSVLPFPLTQALEAVD